MRKILVDSRDYNLFNIIFELAIEIWKLDHERFPKLLKSYFMETFVVRNEKIVVKSDKKLLN